MKINASQRLLASECSIEFAGQGELINAAVHEIVAERLQNYVKRLKKLGIKRLGGGSFANVFQHPTLPDVVVKLLVENDWGYEQYVKFSQKNPANKYVPKILQVVNADQAFDKKHEADVENLRLIFMEKLQPALDDDYLEFANDCSATLYLKGNANFARMDSAINYMNSVSTWVQLSTQKKDPQLAALAQFIVKTRGKRGAALDMHSGNIMMRGNQVVVTDPFSTYD